MTGMGSCDFPLRDKLLLPPVWVDEKHLRTEDRLRGGVCNEQQSITVADAASSRPDCIADLFPSPTVFRLPVVLRDLACFFCRLCYSFPELFLHFHCIPFSSCDIRFGS